MSFGLRTWGAGGALELDTDSFTYQILHSQTYTLGTVITVPVSGLNPNNCSAVILPIGNVDSSRQYCYDAMPYVTVSSDSVTIQAKNPSEPDSGIASRISFRLLVMRYKN